MSQLLVVTPTLGRSLYLRDTISSVVSAAKDGVKVIYRAIGPALARELVEKELRPLRELGVDARFLTESGKVPGLYAAINEAVANESELAWKAFTYINDDDALGPGFVKAWGAFLGAGARAFTYGRVRLIDGAGRSLGFVPTIGAQIFFEPLLAQGISPLNQQGMIVPRELWHSLSGFRTKFRLCADLDFWLRACRRGHQLNYFNKEVGHFRIQAGQLSGDTERLGEEIAAVVADCADLHRFSIKEFLFSRWIFRLANTGIYMRRALAGQRLRGMELLAAGGVSGVGKKNENRHLK
jgi:hypothetical protein